MAKWLEHKEKIFRHKQYLSWLQNGSLISTPRIKWNPPGLELDRFLHMAKHPTVCAVPIDQLIKDYGTMYFCPALACFIALANEPNLIRAQLEARICGIRMPFGSVPVWHRIKYLRKDPVSSTTVTTNSIHVWPATIDTHGHTVPVLRPIEP